MPRKKLTIFKITPQTHVRATQGDSVLFRIPEADLRPDGLKRKLRLVQYNEYKRDLREWATHLKFEFPDHYFHVTFHMPVSRSWRNPKKIRHHGQPHRLKPDADNLIKALKDALSSHDQVIWDYRVTKLWTNEAEGRIEVNLKYQ